MRRWKLDQEKFDNLVHYIILKCPDMDKLGSVKLHKILWKSDTEHYLRFRRPITGARYTKSKWGPTTNALLKSRERLKAQGRIDYWKDDKFADGYEKYAYKAKEGVPAAALTDEERSILDHWIEEICMRHTAASISDESHGYAWDIAAMGEELPMEAVLVERGREPQDEELERVKKKAKELGLI